MQGDDVGLFARESPQGAIAQSDVAMRSSVKSVSADAVPAIEMIRNGIQVGLLRKRMMKCGIENGYLGDVFAEKFSSRQNALDVIGIVQWRQINTILDPF